MAYRVARRPKRPVGLGPRGQTRLINCSGAVVDIAPGASIQTATNDNPAGTVFCLGAGVHFITGQITPKTGNRYLGAFGAIVDGSSWTSTVTDDAAFGALNLDIDDVTIQNLVIRDMPQCGVNAYRDFSDRWTIDHCEFSSCVTGVGIPPNSVITSNYIHDCIGDSTNVNPALRGGAYSGNQAHGSLFENNEISSNGPEQKMILSSRVTFRYNFVHHHTTDGIWWDGGGAAVAEFNIVEDHGRDGIVLENVTGAGVVHHNILRRNAEAILLADTHDVDVHRNILENNDISLSIFKDLDEPTRDLTSNTLHHNTVTIQAGDLAGLFQIVGTGTSTAWTDNTKQNNFDHNSYTVPNSTGNFWNWGNVNKTWEQWQAVPQDPNSSRTVP